MTMVLYTLGLVLFFAAIVASIALHEVGHLVPARRFGAKVTQYFVGFGKTVWSVRRGETEYGIKAIPLGGFVKIVGMLPPSKDAPDQLRDTNTGLFTQLISDARAAEAQHIQPGDEARLFYKLPWWKKVVVMAGGPSVNIAIAFAIFTALFATYGNPGDVKITTTVVEVAPCVVPYDESGRACRADDPVTPAVRAGLQPGDQIVGFNGTEVTSWAGLQTLIRANSDGAAVLTIERDGEELTLRTNTTVTARPTSADDATPVQVGFLGVVPDSYLGGGGVGYTLGQMGGMTVDVAQSLASLPAKVFDVAQAIVGIEERDPLGPVSIVGGGRLAGEAAASEQIQWTEKLVFLLMMVAGFNFFIGMFNFLPLLPLDGGHIAGALWEGLRSRIARILGRPDPGYVDVAKLLPIAYGVAALMLVMGVVLIVGDLVVPIRLS